VPTWPHLNESMLKRVPAIAGCAGVLVLAAFALAQSSHRFWGAPLSALVFAATLTCLPRSRPAWNSPICPWNWALLLFSLQLLVMPLLITIQGVALAVLPALPSPFAINLAVLFNSLQFVIVCLIYSGYRRRARVEQIPVGNRTAIADTGKSVLFYALIGMIGIACSFSDPSGILEYFENPAYYSDYLRQSSSTWQGLAAILLKPFLGFAIVLCWCRWIDSAGNTASWPRRAIVAVLVGLGIVLGFSLIGYSRGAVAVPLVSITAVAWTKDKAARTAMLIIGFVLLALSPAYAIYRTGSQLRENPLTNLDLAGFASDRMPLSDTVQMYGGAPQFLGFLIERSNWGSEPHWGRLIGSSIISPVPVLGKDFRATSGFATFNRLIYGTDAIADQNAPFIGEAFLDLNLAGVFLAPCLLGCALCRLQSGFESSQSSIEMYIWQCLGIWASFVIIASIEVPSQMLIYSCWPFYLFWFQRARLRRRLRPEHLRAQAI